MALRVLHVQDHTVPEMSGYAFRSRYLVENQIRLGVVAEVVSSARHRVFDALVEDPLGFRIHRTPWPDRALEKLQLRLPFWRERILTRALARRVQDVAGVFKPDVLHAHSPIFDGQAALRAAQTLHVPVVYEIRAFWEDDAVDKRKFREGSFIYRQVRRIETDVCSRADLVVTICEGLKRDLVARGVPDEKILVVQNGVDGERFRPLETDEELKTRLGLAGTTVAGFIGSFLHYEGLPLLVEALDLMRESHPDLRLLLVGGGEDEERVHARVRELGLGDRVILTGSVPHDDVSRYYSMMDVLVYPRLSKRITELVTPLKPLEALAMEKAVVGSDVGGFEELVKGCPAGHLFESGSARDLARVLGAFLQTEREERSPAAEKSREVVLRRHAWDTLLPPLLDRYGILARSSEGG